MKTQAIIVGAGGHAVSIAETIVAAGYELVALVSSRDKQQNLLGLPVLSAIPSAFLDHGSAIFIGIGDNYKRQQVWRLITSEYPTSLFPAVVHPHASVAKSAILGAGTVVLQGAVVASAAHAGVGCIVNTGAVLEHECDLGDFSSLAPRAVTGGRVTIGTRSALSLGAVIRHGLTVGEDSVIGAASYVHHDIPAGVVAYGVPARIVRKRQPNDRYL